MVIFRTDKWFEMNLIFFSSKLGKTPTPSKIRFHVNPVHWYTFPMDKYMFCMKSISKIMNIKLVEN